MDIFCFEAFEEEQAALKKFNADRFECGYSWKTIQEYGVAERPPAPVISLRTQSVIPSQWAPHLRGIITRSTGYDHLTAYRQLTGAKLHYGYLPLYCNRAVAEQALLLWMSLLRRLPKQQRQFATFQRDGLTGHETLAKCLLVVGVGNIGSEVVKIGQGLGMEVLGVDPVRKFDFVNYCDFAEAAAKADITVCAMNLTSENCGYFNAEKLSQLKQGSLFVNISRGELSPSSGLLKMLEQGHLGGVGMDVYNVESRLGVMLRNGGKAESGDVELNAVFELMRRDDAVLTPHNAFNTSEAVLRKSEQTIAQLEALLKTGKLLWPIPA